MDVTFLLLAYNQKAYVAEAVRSALAQEGPPLKILVSDDASTDETFEIIKNEVSGYSGPHMVELNRNSHNLGIAAHISACMKRINTKHVIAAAADDISLPKRAIRIRESFAQTNALLIHSHFDEIDESGKIIYGNIPLESTFFMRDTSAIRAANKLGLYVGATGAWHRSLFDLYGDIDEGCYEDLILGFRAALENRVAFINEPLVKYRVNVGVSSQTNALSFRDDWITHRRRILVHEKVILEQRLRDTIHSSSLDREVIVNDLRQYLRLNALRLDILNSNPMAFLGRGAMPFLPKIRLLLSERRKQRRYNRKLMER